MRRRARVAEDRAGAERARPELHAALEPADRLARRRARRAVAAIMSSSRHDVEHRAGRVQRAARSRPGRRPGRDRRRACRRAAPFELARPVLEQMVGGQRRAERAAGIARGRLDPDPLELAVAQDLAVGDAVQRDAAGQAQVLLHRSPSRASASGAAPPPRSPPGSMPRGPCRAGVSELFRLARRAAEQRVEPGVGHGQAGAVVEIVHG